MSIHPNQIIPQLNHLIAVCHDGEQGFRTAAEGVEEEHLKVLFTNYCQQRAQLATELQKEVRRLGGTPETGGSGLGALHRGWSNIKSVVIGQDDAAILAECERGEDVAIEEYQGALKSDLPPNVKQIVSRQYAAVKAAHDRIRELEKTHV